MIIKLNEREVKVLSKLSGSDTFKIPESSFIFMRIDVEGLSIPPVPNAEVPDAKPKKVQIPEGKTPVICLNTGKAQFLKLDEKVEIVVLNAEEIILDADQERKN